jgi:polyhydroxybutyrate depolymerase
MRDGFALAIPEGLPPNPLQPPKFLTNPPRWNDGSESDQLPNEPDASAMVTGLSSSPIPDRDDVGFLTAVLDDVANRLGADPRRVFIVGFSNGAGMTFRFAAEQANRVAAIAPVAGHCWVLEPKPVCPVPTLYVVGTADPLIPLRGGDVRNPWSHRLLHRPPVNDTLERWASAIGCGVIPVTEFDRGGVRMDIYPGPVPYRSVTIDGLGHHWPGGKGQLNHRIAGPLSDAVNGTELVWKFFKQFV